MLLNLGCLLLGRHSSWLCGCLGLSSEEIVACGDVGRSHGFHTGALVGFAADNLLHLFLLKLSLGVLTLDEVDAVDDEQPDGLVLAEEAVEAAN